MVKPVKKANLIHQQILGGLIETKPASWECKTLGRDEDGKEILRTTKQVHESLRYPLAQNVSHENVERAARRFSR